MDSPETPHALPDALLPLDDDADEENDDEDEDDDDDYDDDDLRDLSHPSPPLIPPPPPPLSVKLRNRRRKCGNSRHGRRAAPIVDSSATSPDALQLITDGEIIVSDACRAAPQSGFINRKSLLIRDVPTFKTKYQLRREPLVQVSQPASQPAKSL